MIRRGIDGDVVWALEADDVRGLAGDARVAAACCSVEEREPEVGAGLAQRVEVAYPGFDGGEVGNGVVLLDGVRLVRG